MQLKLFATAIAAFSAMSPVLAITSDLLGISINTQTTATIDATQTVKSLKLDSTIDKISVSWYKKNSTPSFKPNPYRSFLERGRIGYHLILQTNWLTNLALGKQFTLDVVQNIVTGAQALAFTAAQQLIKNPTQVFEPQGQLSICANYKAVSLVF